MKHHPVTIFAEFCVLGVATVGTASPPSLCAGTVGSATRMAAVIDVEVAGDTIVVADRVAGLLTYDVSIASKPIQIGSVFLPHSDQVAVSGGYAYMATAEPGPGPTTRSKLRIFDIRTPVKPVEVGFLDLGSTPGLSHSGVGGIDVADGVAYLIAGYGADWQGLRTIDVSQPESPALLATHEFSRPPTDIAVRGTTLYLNDGGLTILDVSDPAAPLELSSFAVRYGATGLAVSNETVYLPTTEGLRLFDVSAPRNPVEIGAFDSPPDWTIDSVHVSTGTALVTYSRYLLQSRVQLLDVSDPSDPVLARDNLDVAGNPTAVALTGDTAYVAVLGGGMRIIDISNPTLPTTTGAVDPTPIAGVRCSRGHASTFGSSSDTLTIAQIPETGDPFPVGSYQAHGGIRDVALVAGLALVAAGESGLGIVDISYPADPAEIVWFTPSLSAERIAVSGSHAYVSSTSAIAVIDITDPAAPSETGVFEGLPGFELGSLTAAGDLILVGALNWHGPGPSRNELWIIDVSQPDRPSLVSSTDLPPWSVTDIEIDDGLAYLTVDWQGLLIYDISDPAAPFEIGGHGQGFLDSYSSIELLDGRAFVASRNRAFQILDASDPQHPVHKGASFEDLDGSSLSIADGRACLLIEHSQLVILDLRSLDSCAAPRMSNRRRITGAARAVP